MLSSLKILTTSIFYSENHIKISVQAILHCHWSISILLLCYWLTFSSVLSRAGFRNNFQDHRRLPIFSESKMSLQGLWRLKYFHKQTFKGAQAWEFFARVFCTNQTHLGMWLGNLKNIKNLSVWPLISTVFGFLPHTECAVNKQKNFS